MVSLKKLKDIDQLRIKYKELGYALINYDEYKIHSYPYDAPWLTDVKFNKLYKKMHKNTLVDRTRCYHLYCLTENLSKLSGDILEVGTWRGGTAAIFTSMLPSKKVYLADTFDGVVKSSKWEHYKDGRHSDTSETLVRDFLKKDMKVSNFTILKGIFPEDTGEKLKDVNLCFVYLDLDVYESTKDAFNYVWGKLVKNGIVAFDDYGMISACPGIKKSLSMK